MRRPAPTPWSDEKCDELRRLWAAGYSASDIAAELDIGVSRCGVIGKARRLGLAARKTPEFKPGPPRPRPPKLRRAVFIAPVPPPEPPPPPLTHPPRMRRLQFMQLKDTHCKWPFGNPRGHPFYFCAADKDELLPYCPYHMRKAFTKPRTSNQGE